MFKNSTRRGLAIGAGLSLVLSGVVSAPAQAAGEVVLAPLAGTSTTTFVTEKFDLLASLAPGQVAGNIAQLKYKIEKASGSAVSYSATATTSAVTAVGSANAIASATTSFVVAPAATSATVPNKLSIAIVGANSVSASVDVKVSAFIDSNSNDSLDSGEFVAERTVSFKKYSDVTSTVAVTQGAEGDTAVKATATLTDINTDQLTGSDITVKFTVSGSDLATAVAASSGVFTSTDSLSLAKDATVSAAVSYRSVKIGASSATMTVTNKSVLRVTTSGVVGDNLKANGSDAVIARLNSAFAVKAIVSSSASGAVAVAGAAVSVQVSTSATLTSTKSLTVNGTTYTTNASLPTLSLTSDANGEALVNVTPAGFVTSETVTFIVKSQNNTTNNLVASFATPTWTVSSTDHGYLKAAPGAAVTVNYQVKDQWGALTTNAYRVVASYDGTTKYTNLSGGKAAVSFTATTSNNVSSNVTNGSIQSQDSSTLNWSDVAGVTTASAIALLATSTADAFDVSPAATASATISRAITSGVKLDNAVELTGSVNNAGATVTVTGTGVEFSKTGDTATSVGSITLNTDASGHFTVSAYVKTVGAKTVTYTVGTATKTTVITPAAAAGTAGKTLTVTADDRVDSGVTLIATIKLVDEYGNPVAADNAGTEDFSVTATGLGFAVAAMPTKLNSNGEATVAVLLGSADAGSVVFTATYDADGTGTAKAAVTATKTVTVGAAEVNAVIGSFQGRWAVRVENAKGQVVSVKVGGKWYRYTALNNNYVFSRKSKVGASVLVRVWVNGELQNEQTTTIK
ncbi:hypothetical protein HRU87_00635 [Aquiluna borgnonia]|uniref:Big-1 domain-containing protein n=1 Tax=Aquiluna borgnonia TaxID=2499157 RepID=A0A7D4TQQ2_9MICO|nr:hypothetical protein [Aquiluna borgnonia]QKJ24753.1 hypothetical protein HRU87_00635 [Aquiluna borgnonia]